ncbi:MAG TPA: hypothetical protein VEY90_02590 [Thermoleophilaceae bacterium]|nr:hypothetical protein [Thermoleophilaceae bacterium]
MTLTARDKKLAFVIVPIVLIVAYWFLLLAPKREAASAAATNLAKQEQRRDAAKALVEQTSAAKTDFAADYAEIVRLGKAIPAHVDMPSLIVQLDAAASGAGIRFTKISAGERQSLAAPVDPSGAPPASAGSTPPAAAGGTPAESTPGTSAEAANDAAAAQSGVSPADASTSTATREGGLPVGGGSTPAAGAEGATVATGPAGLETVPLELEFTGHFFRLADFFHDIKRFVDVAERSVLVNGRLVTVESVDIVSDPELFPKVRANVTATVYLAPKAEGATAGATPQGPAATTPAATGGETAPSDGAATSPAPTAAATP